MAFSFKQWIEIFKENPGYNDTNGIVTIHPRENTNWAVLGVHKLTPNENEGNHNIYLDVLCKQNDRDSQRAVHWSWEGMRLDQTPGPAYADKPDNEVKDIPIFPGMVIDLWIQGGDRASGFRIDLPDEGTGNTFGHHSYFVVFREVDKTLPDPEPEPEPDPDPGDDDQDDGDNDSENNEWHAVLKVNDIAVFTVTISPTSEVKLVFVKKKS